MTHITTNYSLIDEREGKIKYAYLHNTEEETKNMLNLHKIDEKTYLKVKMPKGCDVCMSEDFVRYEDDYEVENYAVIVKAGKNKAGFVKAYQKIEDVPERYQKKEDIPEKYKDNRYLVIGMPEVCKTCEACGDDVCH